MKEEDFFDNEKYNELIGKLKSKYGTEKIG